MLKFFTYILIDHTIFTVNINSITVADVNECNSIPCLHNGTCADLVNGFNCSCAGGYTGVLCETGEMYTILK